ncbi:hypothetical protein [Verrucosispora sp. TAA-831]|uniref:hypothetical protein n=1 Tax=Verrucosispora sp. TAA-831 TaxID=3422227 RepID=UPI003D6FC7DF
MQTITHAPGDELDIDGTTIRLCRSKGNTGVRWSWYAPELDTAGEVGYPTPEQAIDHAHRTLASPRCACGNIAQMTGSTARVCSNCI